ncbi:hypothetical protein ScPMuIL_007414 [Solemya velum]
MANRNFSMCDFTVHEKIGSGVFGEVFKVKLADTQEEYALKKINLQKFNAEKEQIYPRREEKIHKSLLHERIVAFKCSFIDQNYLCLVLELCRGGNLSQYIQRNDPCVKIKSFFKFTKQICDGLEYIHSKDILHRDLKPQNIFLTERKTIKIGDLGVARLLEDPKCRSILTVGIGTPYYMSPELMNGQEYNKQTDVWSMGCTLYEMATREHAFEASTIADLKAKVSSGMIPTKLDQSEYPSEIKQLISQMIQTDQNKRPSVQKIRESICQCEQQQTQNISSGYYSTRDTYDDSSGLG